MVIRLRVTIRSTHVYMYTVDRSSKVNICINIKLSVIHWVTQELIYFLMPVMADSYTDCIIHVETNNKYL